MLDVSQTIISQYAASPIIRAIADAWSESVSAAADLDAFYDLVWNVETATGWGLDVWGRIVGVSRVIQVPTDEPYFGFQQALPDIAPFNQGTFYGGTGATQNFALSDAAFRGLIYAKALSNICDGGMAAINRILLLLFPGRGNCYCTDGANMTMTYTFAFALTAVELAIVSQSGVLAKPACVVSSIVT